MWKVSFQQTGHSGNSGSWLEWVASLSRELIAWLDWKFCPIVLQLSWPFSSPCMLHMYAILVTSQSRASPETPLNCTLIEISSHSLTHYPYIIPT